MVTAPLASPLAPFNGNDGPAGEYLPLKLDVGDLAAAATLIK
jgi:hypothetical protein